MSTFTADIAAIRQRARAHMENGPVTESYKADRAQVINVLNEALATELVCVLRYKSHYYAAVGLNSETAKGEFQEHARQEQEHADWLAERISQLGGRPNFNPIGIMERSHSEYVEVSDLQAMIREDLVAERIAIESYSEIIRWLGNDDPTSRKLMEDILKVEEEHADDMANLLVRLSP